MGLELNNLIASKENAEKVVKPPKKPTIAKTAYCGIKFIAKPAQKLPARLISNIALAVES